MGIRFWSRFRLPVDTRDIGGRLRQKTEAEGQRSIRIDLNMPDPYQENETTSRGRHFRKVVKPTMCPYIGRKFNVSEPDYPAQSIIQFICEWVQIVRAVLPLRVTAPHDDY